MEKRDGRAGPEVHARELEEETPAGSLRKQSGSGRKLEREKVVIKVTFHQKP